MADEFKEGDVVQLKSGGPRMTVESAGDEGFGMLVYCVWFEKNAHHRQSFKPGMLDKM